MRSPHARSYVLCLFSVTLLIILRDCLCRSSSASRPTESVTPAGPWNDPDDLDRQKVYLLAPSPYQRWTSHYAHPRSELSPSFAVVGGVEESRLADLLTPSKDWWTGHKTGTAENTTCVLPKLDFDDDDTPNVEASEETSEETSTSRTTRSTRASRRTTRTETVTEESSAVSQEAPAAAAEAEQSEPSAEPAAEYDFQVGGGDADDDVVDDESGDVVDESAEVSQSDESPSRPAGTTSRRASNTPSRHRRQWTHTIVPGVEEARIHRKGGRHLF